MLERILNLIENSGLSDAAFCQKLSLGNGIVGKWRSGKQKPSLDAVIKIAVFFNVSIHYLATGTDSIVCSYTKEDDNWIALIHQLPKETQIRFRGDLMEYLARRKDII